MRYLLVLVLDLIAGIGLFHRVFKVRRAVGEENSVFGLASLHVIRTEVPQFGQFGVAHLEEFATAGAHVVADTAFAAQAGANSRLFLVVAGRQTIAYEALAAFVLPRVPVLLTQQNVL